MKREIKVLGSRCPQNHYCPSVRVCPNGAIKQQGFGAPTIDMEKCTSCGICLRSCPYKVFQG
jgi:Fe-S-cluster-containing hydrogenase component 2